MPFSFHPPTGRSCPICEHLAQVDFAVPVIDTQSGKASSANNYPFHHWYNFVLGYSPQFPEYMLQRENIGVTDTVLDPFMGTGTTLVVCKQRGIPCIGVDANDFMIDAARAKLNWELDTRTLKQTLADVVERTRQEFRRYQWAAEAEVVLQHSLFDVPDPQQTLPAELLTEYVAVRRPTMLLQKYVSDKPLARLLMIANVIAEAATGATRAFFDLALDATIVPVSNVRYGPGFGMIRPKEDMPVLELFTDRVNRMIRDLQAVSESQRRTSSDVLLGDARRLTDSCEPESISFMITSPPYPGDHEYTKHTRLELLFRGYAGTHAEFQTIKRRMIRASTTNIYREDQDRRTVQDVGSIQRVTQLIQERLEEDGATSGFEKLYTKLVWEYFGGMDQALRECWRVLRPGGKIALLVSDSHAFKMVHIETAAILGELGLRAGFENAETVLWQFKPSTSHNYALRENVLILTKPRN